MTTPQVGYFRFPALPICLALYLAAALYLVTGKGFVSLPGPRSGCGRKWLFDDPDTRFQLERCFARFAVFHEARIAVILV